MSFPTPDSCHDDDDTHPDTNDRASTDAPCRGAQAPKWSVTRFSHGDDAPHARDPSASAKTTHNPVALPPLQTSRRHASNEHPFECKIKRRDHIISKRSFPKNQRASMSSEFDAFQSSFSVFSTPLPRLQQLSALVAPPSSQCGKTSVSVPRRLNAPSSAGGFAIAAPPLPPPPSYAHVVQRQNVPNSLEPVDHSLQAVASAMSAGVPVAPQLARRIGLISPPSISDPPFANWWDASTEPPSLRSHHTLSLARPTYPKPQCTIRATALKALSSLHILTYLVLKCGIPIHRSGAGAHG